MSTKRKTYSAEFKAKVVLEVLEAEQSINEIASKYELLPANVKNWKKIFLENMSLAFDKITCMNLGYHISVRWVTKMQQLSRVV
jgi:putative transposase